MVTRLALLDKPEQTLQRRIQLNWIAGIALVFGVANYVDFTVAQSFAPTEPLAIAEPQAAPTVPAAEITAAVDAAVLAVDVHGRPDGITASSTVGVTLPSDQDTADVDIESSDVEDFIVMIDPGHGGSDPGSRAPNGLLEKDLTLDIAERTQLFLSEVPGLKVVTTRSGDTGLSRQRRVNAIRASGADMVVSLHFNHLPQTDITLVESFYAGRSNILESRSLQREAGAVLHTNDSDIDLTFTEGSARLAKLVQNRVFNQVRSESPETIDAGAKQDTLFVLTRSFVAGTLVELTCISNPEEAERLTSETYRNDLAAGIADAVRDYRESLKSRPLGGLDV